MKHKKLILSLALLIISIIYIIHPFILNKETNVNSFKDQIIRFHIKANSDEKEDQALKLKIRDELLKKMKVQFEKSNSIEETREIIKNNIDNIKYITEEMIKEEGKDFSVDVSLGNRNFPTRKYGNITFPSGEYETLQVSIGEGKGENWWCVMFPPLCFVDMDHSNANNVEKDLKKVLTEEEINLLLSHKEPPIILKSKIAEVLEKTKNNLAKGLARRY